MLREAVGFRPSRPFRALGTGAWGDALIVALVAAATGSVVFLGLHLQIGDASNAPLSGLEQASARCTSAATSPAPTQSTRKEESMKKALVVAGLIALAGSVFAHDQLGTDEAKEFVAEEISFKDDPAFPKGAQTVVLHGDPTKPGLFILRAKFPPNYVVPPHTHPGFETVTVLTGAMGSGMGEKADLTKGKMLKAGGMLALPANHAHYVWTTDEETIIQVAAVGPFDLVYINPADDPRKK